MTRVSTAAEAIHGQEEAFSECYSAVATVVCMVCGNQVPAYKKGIIGHIRARARQEALRESLKGMACLKVVSLLAGHRRHQLTLLLTQFFRQGLDKGLHPVSRARQ